MCVCVCMCVVCVVRDRVPEDQPVSEFIFTLGNEVSKDAIDLAQKEPRSFVIGKGNASGLFP